MFSGEASNMVNSFIRKVGAGKRAKTARRGEQGGKLSPSGNANEVDLDETVLPQGRPTFYNLERSTCTDWRVGGMQVKLLIHHCSD
jgi:hypothetical protein